MVRDPNPAWLTLVLVGSQVAVLGATVFVARRAEALGGISGGASRRVGIFLGVWLAAASILGALGVLEADPEVIAPYIALPLVVPIVVGVSAWRRSPGLRALVDATPIWWLIGLQVYRALGVLFLVQWGRGALPGAFAWPAGIGDIAVGLLAVPVAWMVAGNRPGARRLAIGWNLLGIGDLVLAVTLGFLSSPTPFQLVALGQPNNQVTAFPLVLIPAFAVPLSILLHLASLHQLRAARPVVRDGVSSTHLGGH
ncbi:MAG: hypothetical protein L0206_07930 [Actinobacteria bacterium]|nr:hypothetical protein [Actinomycetota bacterium]